MQETKEREIKIRYIYKNRLTKKIKTLIVTLDDLESGGLAIGWPIVMSRDMFTEFHDKGSKELYENDVVYSETYIDGVELLGWIEFNEDRGTYQVNLGQNHHPLTDITMQQMAYFEKKGNAIENPELMNEIGRPRSELEQRFLDRLQKVKDAKD
jgi:hypothetical protein